MKIYNCIVVFDEEQSHILFCKREKEPYKGLYNFVGGKVENGENGLDAAYRELFEETGIDERQITLYQLMDITYYQQGFVLEIYIGKLSSEVTLIEEANPLKWISVKENFANQERFSGEQNIAHIVNVALKYPINNERNDNLFAKYKELAQKEENVLFGGRLGQYRYYDMDKVIEAALEMVKSQEA